MNTNKKNGFTLIELIIVMVILGIMAAVAVPRYLDSISNAEEAAEDAVISAIKSGLTQYANNKLYEDEGNGFTIHLMRSLKNLWLFTDTDDVIVDVDGEWTFINGRISHQRAIIAQMVYDQVLVEVEIWILLVLLDREKLYNNKNIYKE